MAWMLVASVKLHPCAGDAAKNSYARELSVSYRKILFSKTYVYGTDALELPAGICAYIVSLQPCESVDKGFEFRLRFISKQGVWLCVCVCVE